MVLTKFIRLLKNTNREIALLFGFVLLGISLGNAQNTISIGTYNIQHSTQFTVDVEVSNADPVLVFQTDITIPNGLEYVVGSAQLNASRENGHQLSASINGNVLRLVVFTYGSDPIVGNSGTLVSFDLLTKTTPGNFSLALSESLLSDDQGSDILTGTSNGTVTVLAPDIHTSVTSIDFGRVALQSTGNRSFTVSNPGNQTLNISDVLLSEAQFTSSPNSAFNLNASESQLVSLSFSPTVKGTYNETIAFTSNDPDEATKVVNLSAVAYAVNELHTGNMSAQSGSTSQLSFSINNMEAFTGFQFELVLPEPLTYIANSATLLVRENGQSVSAFMTSETVLTVIVFAANSNTFSGTSGEVLTLDFDVDGTAGSYALNIQNVIITDNSETNILSDSYNGTLTVQAPDINISPLSYNFGDVSIMETGTQNITIQNTGQLALQITHLIFDNAYFSCDETLPFSINAGSSQQITVEFQKSTRGAETGNLEIRSNDPNENPLDISLSASAFVPNYIVGETNTVTQGGTSEITVEINNEENFVAFQFDLSYPSGITPDLDNITLSDRKSDHTISVSDLGNNTLRIFAYSANSIVFSGSSGTVVSIPISAANDLSIDDYTISLNNGLLSNAASEDILWDVQNGTLSVTENTGIKLDVKLFLEGPFSESAMLTTLNTAGLIPLSQPYNTSPWDYSGTESVGSIPAGVVDWVLLELRQAAEAANATEATILEKKAAFLKSDGSVVDLDGTSVVQFSSSLSGGNNLYVVVRHRNHLAIMSNTGASLNGDTYEYDFTTAVTQAYGGTNGYKEISTSVFGMVAGDANSDQSIYINDYTDFWIPATGFNNSYNCVDFNLDGQVYINDYTDYWIPNSGKSIVLPN